MIHKFRMPGWYWGNYCVKTPTGKFTLNGKPFVINENDLEPYVEEAHGWHNSEEFKNGRLVPYKKE